MENSEWAHDECGLLTHRFQQLSFIIRHSYALFFLQNSATAAASASVNSTPARYRGGALGFGSSNFAQAIAPRKRITKSSFGMLTRTFWFGLRIVFDRTCAPTVDRSTTLAGLPSS